MPLSPLSPATPFSPRGPAGPYNLHIHIARNIISAQKTTISIPTLYAIDVGRHNNTDLLLDRRNKR